MFGIGSTELLVILVVALIVLGPKSIPGLAKTLGKVMGEFRRVSTEFQRTMNAEVAQDEHEKRKKEAEEELFGNKAKAETAPTAPQPAPTAPPAAPQAAAQTDATPPSPAATATVDAASAAPVSTAATSEQAAPVDASTGINVAPDSPLAQAVARAEAEARGEVYSPAPTTAQESAPKSGEKA